MSEASDSYEKSRCEKYGTTIYSCTCPGYIFRKTCRHLKFMREQLVNNGGVSSSHNQTKFDIYDEALEFVEDGMDATIFINKFDEKLLDRAKVIGDVFEKHGRLYQLK